MRDCSRDSLQGLRRLANRTQTNRDSSVLTAALVKSDPLMNIIPLRDFPFFRTGSPEVVQILDRIRFELDQSDTENSNQNHVEFSWFAREYPRCYRYHLDCADFRLKTIWDLYREIHSDLSERLDENKSDSEKDGTPVQIAVSDKRVQRIYWDFESFLSEINIALDLLARVAGTAFNDEMPVSFNRFC